MHRREFIKSAASATGAFLNPSPALLDFAPPTGDPSIAVDGMTCEYLETPLGLDVTSPRLSWRLLALAKGARGHAQSAYRVQVASTASLLAQSHPDLWDSGEVVSAQSQNIAYRGAELTRGASCHWRVRVADERGRWSSWSATSRWTMGPMRPEDWTARWIGTGRDSSCLPCETPADNTMPDPWFRKSFTLREQPAEALMYVASVGYHELYVNGQKIGDGILAPSATDFRTRSRYVSYDIAAHLRAGTNAIGLWLGRGWSIFPAYQTGDKPYGPIVLAQADIRFRDGTRQRIVTDETWRTYDSPNTLLGCWDAHRFDGEHYDGGKEIPGWAGIDLDISQWRGVKVYRPALKVSADKTQPNVLGDRLLPVEVKEMAEGVYRIDMGRNFAGWFEMPLEGTPGDIIRFEFSERENEAMTFNLHSTYVLGPGGKGIFRNRFNYMSGRWVTVSGLRGKPSLEGVRGWNIRTNYARASSFTCDDPLLNSICETSRWTFENVSLGSYIVDCPQRERRGYGDGYGSARMALYHYDMRAFFTKWMEDWRDVQGGDGSVPFTAPTYVGGGGPAWSGLCVALPWEFYRQYGDKRALEVNFPTMKRWLAWLERTSAGDMLVRTGGEWDFLGDWQWPGFWADRRSLAKQGKVPGDTREALFFNNCYWVFSLQLVAQIAAMLGDAASHDAFSQRAAQVRAAVHLAFYDPGTATYVNGEPAYLAIALQAGVPPVTARDAVWRNLEDAIVGKHKSHIGAGIIGGTFLWKLLLEERRDELLYAMASQPDQPGWGHMLERGATTFYEDWDERGSYLHDSYLFIGSWFMERIGGIQHSKAGFEEFTIDPWVSLFGEHTGPRRARTHYDSPYGRIATDWAVESGTLRLAVEVPPNTQATVRLRGVRPSSVTESGLQLGKTTGLLAVSASTNGLELRVGSGSYTFRGSIL